MNKRIDLQLLADKTAVSGKKVVYLYRPISMAATDAAKILSFTTENSISLSKDADTTATKDGTVRAPGQMEVEISTTALLAKGDTIYDKLKQAMIDDEIIEVWEANLDEPASAGDNKFKGTYYQAYLTSLEKTASSEEFVEVSTTFAVNGTGKDGDVTVTTEQQEEASYAFKDTQAEGA